MLAVTLTTNTVETAALAATLGFDFLLVEMEHSPITLETLFPFTSTAELARRASHGCRYPPVGLRGSGARLATALCARSRSTQREAQDPEPSPDFLYLLWNSKGANSCRSRRQLSHS